MSVLERAQQLTAQRQQAKRLEREKELFELGKLDELYLKTKEILLPLDNVLINNEPIRVEFIEHDYFAKVFLGEELIIRFEKSIWYRELEDGLKYKTPGIGVNCFMGPIKPGRNHERVCYDPNEVEDYIAEVLSSWMDVSI